MLAEIQHHFSVEEELQQIRKIQTLFDAVIGTSEEKGKIRAYNPVISRANFERTPKDKKENFKEFELAQIETFLQERYRVPKKPQNFIMDKNGQMRSELLPNESFDNVLKRGIIYRAEEGSLEQQRENAELIGWIKVQEYLLNSKTKLGSQILVVSGPGSIENTLYPSNYIDIYESYMDFKRGKRSIKRKRLVSDLTYNQYIEEVNKYDSDYFNDFNGKLDAWFLANPIPADKNNPYKLFESIFNENKNGMSEGEFDKLFIECMPLILNYINFLTSDYLDPRNILLAFNAILVKADALKEKRYFVYKNIKFRSIQEEAWLLGQLQVQSMKIGCGISSGFDLGKNKILTQLLGNSVAQFGTEEGDDGLGPRKFQCTEGHWNERPYGKLIDKCCIKDCKGSVGCTSKSA